MEQKAKVMTTKINDQDEKDDVRQYRQIITADISSTKQHSSGSYYHIDCADEHLHSSGIKHGQASKRNDDHYLHGRDKSYQASSNLSSNKQQVFNNKEDSTKSDDLRHLSWSDRNNKSNKYRHNNNNSIRRQHSAKKSTKVNTNPTNKVARDQNFDPNSRQNSLGQQSPSDNIEKHQPVIRSVSIPIQARYNNSSGRHNSCSSSTTQTTHNFHSPSSISSSSSNHHAPLSSSISSTSSSSGFASSLSYHNSSLFFNDDYDHEFTKQKNYHDNLTINSDQLSLRSSASVFDSLSVRSEEDSIQDTVSSIDVDNNSANSSLIPSSTIDTIGSATDDREWPSLSGAKLSDYSYRMRRRQSLPGYLYKMINTTKISSGKNFTHLGQQNNCRKPQSTIANISNEQNIENSTLAYSANINKHTNVSGCPDSNKISTNNNIILKILQRGTIDENHGSNLSTRAHNDVLISDCSNLSNDHECHEHHCNAKTNYLRQNNTDQYTLSSRTDICEQFQQLVATSPTNSKYNKATAQRSSSKASSISEKKNIVKFKRTHTNQISQQQQKNDAKPTHINFTNNNNVISDDTNRQQQQQQLQQKQKQSANQCDNLRKHKRIRNNPTKRERLQLKQLKYLKQQFEQQFVASVASIECSCREYYQVQNRTTANLQDILVSSGTSKTIDFVHNLQQQTPQPDSSNKATKIFKVHKADCLRKIIDKIEPRIRETSFNQLLNSDNSQLTNNNKRQSLIKHKSLNDSFNNLALEEKAVREGQEDKSKQNMSLKVSAPNLIDNFSENSQYNIQFSKLINSNNGNYYVYASKCCRQPHEICSPQKFYLTNYHSTGHGDGLIASPHYSFNEFTDQNYTHQQHMTYGRHSNNHHQQQKQKLENFTVTTAVGSYPPRLSCDSSTNTCLDSSTIYSPHSHYVYNHHRNLTYNHSVAISSNSIIDLMASCNDVEPPKQSITNNPPPPRIWLRPSQNSTFFDSNSKTNGHNSNSRFSVMCYNILSDIYATKQKYSYCPDYALDWSYRRQKILVEIKSSGSDLVSLQEVETNQFHEFFLPQLKQEGYDGIFAPKSRAKTMLEPYRKLVDGCAIFYKTTKFRLIEQNLIEFNKIAMASARGSDAMLNRVMTKDNIGIAALLELVDNDLSPCYEADQIQLYNVDKHLPDQCKGSFDHSSSLPPSSDSKEWPPLTNEINANNTKSYYSNSKSFHRSYSPIQELSRCDKYISNNKIKDGNNNIKSINVEKKKILVCTAHIHWDPEYCDVKLIQTIMLMNELSSMAKNSCASIKMEKVSKNRRDLKEAQKVNEDNIRIPLVLCGDFNSLPDSGVVKFLTEGKISVDHPDFKNYAYTNCFDLKSKTSKCENNNNNKLTRDNINNHEQSQLDEQYTKHYYHPFNLGTAYNTSIMSYTNYTSSFCGMIDYIFYSKSLLNVKGILGPIDDQWIKENKVIGLPQPNFPSDHFPILAELELNASGRALKSNEKSSPLLLSNILKSKSYYADNIISIGGPLDQRTCLSDEKRNILSTKNYSDNLTKDTESKNK